jgi:hypothetical protein
MWIDHYVADVSNRLLKMFVAFKTRYWGFATGYITQSYNVKIRITKVKKYVVKV